MLKLSFLNSYQKIIAEQLIDENLASFDQSGDLILDDNDVYKVEAEQLIALGAPSFFEGLVHIKMINPPSLPSCDFHIQLYKTLKKSFDNKIKNYTIKGCLLILQDGTRFLLPEFLYNLFNKIRELKNKYDASLAWYIVDLLIENDNKTVEFEAFRTKDNFENIKQIHIDVLYNDDGSLKVKPNIPLFSEGIEHNYYDQMTDKESTVVVISEMKDGIQTRFILQHDVISAYQRLRSVGRIAKEDASKFFKNPISFILEDEESEDDVAINFESCRIIGLGEPYIGYFGSIALDTPMAAALRPTMPVEKLIHQQIKDICLDRTPEEIRDMKSRLQAAIDTHQDSVSLIPGNVATTVNSANYLLALNQLDNVIKKIPKNPPTKDEKVVLKIDPNDESSVIFMTSHLKPLHLIRVDDSDKKDLFEDIVFEPKLHQITGVNWLIDLYQNKFKGGILADDMGLGKTYQIITFINFLFKNWPKDDSKRVLIVAPTVLLENWQSEFGKFLNAAASSRIKPQIIRGQDLKNIKNQVHLKEGSYNSFNVERLLNLSTNVFITTYETLANYQFSWIDERFSWGCIIYDEAQKIKSPNAQVSQAARAISSGIDFNVLLTGTPIENELRDLWALFDVFAPEHFGSWKSFREEYVNKPANEIEDKLRQTSSKYLLRRLKKDHLSDLPNKFEIVHKVVLSIDELHRYEDIKNSGEPALTRLHQLKAFLLHKNLVGNLKNEIDLMGFSKTKKLISLLEDIKSKNEKVIIFTINRMAQAMLIHGIHKHFNINVPFINGDNSKSTKAHQDLEIFKTSPGFGVVVLSTLAAGVGLTITQANHVIHYERWWNASKEDQASDRAYRIGQSKDVFIHHIIASLDSNNQEVLSIDEAVHKLITIKRQTAGFLIPPKNISEAGIINETIPANLEEKTASLNPFEFESLVREIFEKQGYEAHLTSASGQDFGADVIAKKDNEIIAIQCKHTQKNSIQDDAAINQLCMQAKDYYQATKLIAICNSQFNSVAHQLANKHGVGIIEKNQLLKLIDEMHIKVV